MAICSYRVLVMTGVWKGEQMPTLIELVDLYLRRFKIEYWYRCV